VRNHPSRPSHSFLLLIALLAAASPLRAQDTVLTPDLILTIRSVTDVQLSPDGSRAVYQISRPRTAAERPGAAVPELWIVATGGGDPVRFATSPDGDRAAQWSPDGRTIAFLSRRPASEPAQIHLIRVDGGEATRLTSAEGSVQAFRWSPDGTQIAYTVVDPKTKEEIEAERKGQDWIVADRHYQHSRLHAIDVATRKSHVVTTGAITVHDFDWAPDGQRLVIAAADTPTVDDSYMRRKLQTVPASGGAATPVATTTGKLTHPRWSPDGKWIAWLGATALNDPFAGSVFVAPAAGGSAGNLTPGYEGSATWLAWQPGAPATLAFTAIERQESKAYTLDLAGRAAKRTPLPTGTVTIAGGLSFSRDGQRVAFAGDTPAHPPEVYVIDRGAARRVTTTNPQLAGVAFGAQEVVRWKAADGLDIEGVIVKPVGHRPGTRYPLVMQPHGGPEGADLNGWLGTYSRWGQLLAGRGYVTFYPNYRGSIGRGVKYSMGDHRDLMGKEFTDMLSGIDHLVAIGLVDGDRVGVGGGSYGGYTTAWAVTHASDRFKAGVMWMGISNWYSMTGTSDIFFENSTVHWDLMMYDNHAIYWERSPLAHVNKAKTPTLIIHGGADPRVPIGQSQEMYTALRWKGVPVEFVTYPREGHGVSEAAHQLDFMTRVTAWFDRYLKHAGTSRP
jgi:dipeptidyl aminopeptidase/acylaminoacyl peptidase